MNLEKGISKNRLKTQSAWLLSYSSRVFNLVKLNAGDSVNVNYTVSIWPLVFDRSLLAFGPFLFLFDELLGTILSD